MHELPFSSISSLVPVLAETLASYQDLPMAFFGHSMGGIIAFELARYLRREGNRGVAHLFVSASRAPQVKFDEPPTFDLPDPEFVEELRTLNGTPKEVLEHPELLELMIPLLRADFALCETYHYYPEPPLSCPITVLGGLRDHAITREELEAWREQTTASFRLRMLPGDHFFIRTAQALLFQLLAQDLARLI
jgi:medium-chain acyl-[acyl-carrier-protein] hydrolase